VRKGRGEAAIDDYVQAVRERDSYAPQEGEEQTEAREALHKRASYRVKLCFAKLTGGQLGEARRRLAVNTSTTEEQNNV
jgi:hypothetical protein